MRSDNISYSATLPGMLHLTEVASAASAGRHGSQCISGCRCHSWSVTHQLNAFTGVFLQLKAWRFLLCALAAAPLALGAVLSHILAGCDLNAEPELRFYRAIDLATAWQLAADKGQTMQLATSSGIRHGDWPDLRCYRSPKRCASYLLAQLGNGTPLSELLNAKDTQATPLMLECLGRLKSDAQVLCSLIYQRKDDGRHREKGGLEVNMLYLDGTSGTKNVNESLYAKQQIEEPSHKPLDDANSQVRCSASNRLYRTVVAISFSIGTMSVILYFTLSTVYCISQLKQRGFLRRQFQSGMCATAFWLPVLAITLAECLLLSTVFLLSQMIHCSSFAQSDSVLRVFAAFSSHCLSLALLAILSITVQPSFTGSCMLMMLLNLALITAFAYAPGLIEGEASTVLFLFPPINALQYIKAYISTDGVAQLTSKKMRHFDNTLPCLVATPAVLVVLTVYIDFILPRANGLQLPFYFPLTLRFWLPQSGHPSPGQLSAAQHAPSMSDMSAGGSDQAFVEPALDTWPAVTIDRASVTYNDRGCASACCGRKALNRVTCKIYPGRITWITGPSSSGKSTLLRLLSGFFPPASSARIADSASVMLWHGAQATGTLDRLGLRHRVGSISGAGVGPDDDGVCPCLTVKQCMVLCLASRGAGGSCGGGSGLDGEGTSSSGCYGDMTPRELLIRLGLAGLEDLTPIELSMGQKRLLSLAMALAGSPELLLLDEPTRGLEPAAQQRVWRLLRDISRASYLPHHRRDPSAVVVATDSHNLAPPPIVPEDRIVLLSAGRVTGTGSQKFLTQALDCRLSSLKVSLLSAGCAQELLQRLPSGRVREWRRRGQALRLQIETEGLLDCVSVLESALGELVSEDGIQLDPPPQPTGRLSEASCNSNNSRTSAADVNNSDNSISEDSAESEAPLQPRRSNSCRSRDAPVGSAEPACALDSSSEWFGEDLNPSVLRRLRTLFNIQVTRQFRSPHSIALRVIMPALLFAFLILTAAHEKAFYRIPVPLDAVVTKGVIEQVITSCVYNANEAEIRQKVKTYDVCKESELNLSSSDILSPEELFSQPSTLSQLREYCLKPYATCLIIQPGVGNQSTDSVDLSKTILTIIKRHSLFGNETANHHRNKLVGLYREALAKISNQFGLQPKLKSSIFQYELQGGSCAHIELVLLIFATLFSIFPATFMKDVTEDMETRVYHYLTCIGMKRAAYWTIIIAIHWCLYASYFLFCVLIFELWDQFHNAYYFCCVHLPVIVFGTISNLLSVYTTAAMPKRRVPAVEYSYYILVVLVPWAVNGVSKLGNIPTLAMIWMVPQSAPVALMLFGMKLSGQRITYGGSGSDEFLYQLWDMHSTLWSNTLFLNAFAAMPVHIVLLSLLLASSECDVRALWPACCAARRRFSLTMGRSSTENVITELQLMQTEIQYAEGATGSSTILNVNGMWKTCPQSGFPIVKGIAFKLARDQTLTLLGASGSGKSATAAVVAGEMPATSGDCHVACQCSLDSQTSGRHSARCGAVGYCPQYCPLYGWLTVFEQLLFYARIRGLSSDCVAKRIKSLLTCLGLKQLKRRFIFRLDRCQQRRVCLAVALLPRPALLILDRSGGADGCLNESLQPVRRFLKRQDVGQSVEQQDRPNRFAVLDTAACLVDADAVGNDDSEYEIDRIEGDTGGAGGGLLDGTAAARESSPGDDAEAQGRRLIGVLHRGRLIALGTERQLRSNFGDWYTLDITLDPDTEAVIEDKKSALGLAVLTRFKDAFLLEEGATWLQFCVPRLAFGRLSDALRWLAGAEVAAASSQAVLYRMSLDQAVSLRHLTPARRHFPMDQDIVT